MPDLRPGDLVRLTDEYRENVLEHPNLTEQYLREFAPWIWEVGLIVEVLEPDGVLLTLFSSGVMEMNPHTPFCLVEASNDDS